MIVKTSLIRWTTSVVCILLASSSFSIGSEESSSSSLVFPSPASSSSTIVKRKLQKGSKNNGGGSGGGNQEENVDDFVPINEDDVGIESTSHIRIYNPSWNPSRSTVNSVRVQWGCFTTDPSGDFSPGGGVTTRRRCPDNRGSVRGITARMFIPRRGGFVNCQPFRPSSPSRSLSFSVVATPNGQSCQVRAGRPLSLNDNNDEEFGDDYLAEFDDEIVGDDEGDVGIESNRLIRITNGTGNRVKGRIVFNRSCSPSFRQFNGPPPGTSDFWPRTAGCRDTRVREMYAFMAVGNREVECQPFFGPTSASSFIIQRSRDGLRCRVVPGSPRLNMEGEDGDEYFGDDNA